MSLLKARRLFVAAANADERENKMWGTTSDRKKPSHTRTRTQNLFTSFAFFFKKRFFPTMAFVDKTREDKNPVLKTKGNIFRCQIEKIRTDRASSSFPNSSSLFLLNRFQKKIERTKPLLANFIFIHCPLPPPSLSTIQKARIVLQLIDGSFDEGVFFASFSFSFWVSCIVLVFRKDVRLHRISSAEGGWTSAAEGKTK